MQEDAVEIKSKYNSGVAQLYRLDGLWRNTHQYAVKGKYKLWNTILDRLWCELARDLSDKEYKEYKEEFDGFDEALSKLGEILDTAPDGWVEITSQQKTNRIKQYKILNEKDLFLRRLENHLGKGTAWNDGTDNDWE